MANGRAQGQDPYFSHCYCVGLDGTDEIALTPAEGTHSVQLSPGGGYLVDTCSSATSPPVVSLRDAKNGALLMTLDETDLSALLKTRWKPPVPIVVKAADGETDLCLLCTV